MVICDYCKAVLKTKEELHNHHLKAHSITIQQRSADETKDRRKSFRNKKKSLNKIESDESEAAFAKYQFDFEHGDIPVCSNDKKDGNQLVEESDQGDDDEFFDANESFIVENDILDETSNLMLDESVQDSKGAIIIYPAYPAG